MTRAVAVLTCALACVLTVLAAPAHADGRAPGAPRDVALHPSSSSVTVRWTAAGPHGSSVNQYRVVARRWLSAHDRWSRWSSHDLPPRARAHRVNAAAGTKVESKVRARNANGWGPWSPTRVATAGAPGAVPGTRAVTGKERASVHWRAAASNGARVIAYRVSWRPTAGDRWTSFRVSAGARSATVHGLVAGRSVRLLVRAVNARGVGRRGAIVSATPQAVSAGQLADALVEQTNRARARGATCGSYGYRKPAPPVRASATLSKAATAHARDMLARGYFGHVSPEGDGPGDRASAAGYEWRAFAENLAGGYRTAADVVEGWLRSPQHCQALMNPTLTELGTGYAVTPTGSDNKWVQLFATPA